MELKNCDKYYTLLQEDMAEGFFYQSILWLLESNFWEDDEPKSAGEIIDLILMEKPEYLAFGDLRYIRQDKLDDSEWLTEYVREVIEEKADGTEREGIRDIGGG